VEEFRAVGLLTGNLDRVHGHGMVKAGEPRIVDVRVTVLDGVADAGERDEVRPKRVRLVSANGDMVMVLVAEDA